MQAAKLKRIDCLNDYVAIIAEKVSDVVDVDSTKNKFKCEGVICGLGTAIPEHLNLQLGERVVFRQNTYQVFKTSTEDYKGKEIILVRTADFIAKVGRSEDYEFYADKAHTQAVTK
jgi:hypothetical protein